MFTGLVAALGSISAIEQSADGVRVTVAADGLASQLRDGDSVAVNGVCLTAVEVGEQWFAAEVMNETLARSSLRDATVGTPVNLELPLRPSDRLGGHIVQGHVDGVGSIEQRVDDGFAVRVKVTAPGEVLRYVVEKGSIAVDGISLTVAAVDSRSFTVSLIPETLQRTNLGSASPGTEVNLEVDVLAKYVERLLTHGHD
jgi:riboflavin synthase